MEHNNYIYSIDRIRIISQAPINILSKELPSNSFNKWCRRYFVDFGSEAAKLKGFPSKIEVIAPKRKFFELLLRCEALLQYGYSISYIETARDLLCASKNETISLAEEIFKHLRKKYTYRHFLYDDLKRVTYDGSNEHDDKCTKTNRAKRKKYTPDMYSDRTAYWGNKRFQLVVYPRISKIVERPCVHKEWKIQGSQIIERKMRIALIKDILDFMDIHIETWFDKQYEKFITFEEINHEKHGRFLVNMPRGAKTAGYGYSGYFGGRFKKAEPVMASRIHCNVHNIETAPQLRNYYKNELSRIKKKGQGKRTRWEDKIVNLTNYKLNSFFNSIDFKQHMANL